MKWSCLRPLGLSLYACAVLSAAESRADPASPGHGLRMRIGAAQPRARLVDYRRAKPAEVLAQVDRSLGELEQIVHHAGAAGCDAIALPEDTLGLGTWEAAHKTTLREVLPEAVKRMLDRLGRAAAAHRMYLVCCNDTLDPDGSLRNTAFFLGRDGREIGHYHKVNMPIHELDKRRGDRFPVFKTPDLGGVGMLICYDMVFPEAARCLALNGADIIFDPTEGGAAIGDDDLNRAAFRTRAVENFVYLVVAQRGGGSMIISPQGKILAEGKTPDEVVIAEIDPFAGREGGDAMNAQSDMRARLFRERSPAAFGTLTDPNPPVLAKVPETMTIAEAVRISAGVLTAGDQEFNAAAALAGAGKTNEAIAAFRRLRSAYRNSWIDRVSAERLAKLGADTDGPVLDKKSATQAAAIGEPPARTTLSDPGISFTVPDKPYVVLRRGPIEAVVVDNRAVDDAVLPGHRAGYHGVASLKHAQQPRNLVVPAYAGLNFEHIHDGTTQPPDVLFEPRRAPMELRTIDNHTVELHQPPTPHWGLESCLRYELLENGALEMTFECIPRRATWKQDYLGLFWASYIHQPESLDIHFLGPGAGDHLEWVRGVTPEHGIRATHRAAADDRDFVHDADFPMSLVFNFSEHRSAEPWYFGECRGLAFAEIFRAEDQVRFSQSPSGGGAGNPAWDFQWFISNPRIGRRYQLVMRALYTPLPRADDNASAREQLREQIKRVQFSRPAEPRTPASRAGVGFFVDPRTNSDNPEQRMAYGLNVTPPWRDGGSIFINLPEHLEYMPGTRGIARHHDARRNVWQVSPDGTGASYAVESLTESGVFFGVRARADGDRAFFEMSLTNRSAKTLRSIRPLFCFQYHSLNGFPPGNSDNFAHTYAVIGGKPVSIGSLPVKNPQAHARMAQVDGCTDEHNWWAEQMGGLIEQRLDCALTILTARDDDRKVAVLWRPGKNLLSNRAIPCLHADPCFGDLAPGEARTVQGELIFTRAPLAQIVSEATAEQTAGQPSRVARGLAAKYPGDVGIAADPDVLFAENFETGSVEETGKRWGAISNQDGKVMAFSDDVPPVSGGKRSLQMTATLGENTGGHLYTRLPRGADKVFARFYVKFAPDAGYLHHFVTLGGYHPATAWPQGGAGERPRGDERFTAGIEPYGNYGRYPAPGAWNFYAYWPEMKGSADGRFWGNSLTPVQPALVPRDRWQCVEVMLQCNSAPDKSDGELALWLDGQPTLHIGPGARRSRWTGLGFSLMDQGGEPFEGFRWRTSRDLQINFFWLLHYVTENAPRQNHVAASNRINRVWFDDIVVSTAYIGPISR